MLENEHFLCQKDLTNQTKNHDLIVTLLADTH